MSEKVNAVQMERGIGTERLYDSWQWIDNNLVHVSLEEESR